MRKAFVILICVLLFPLYACAGVTIPDTIAPTPDTSMTVEITPEVMKQMQIAPAKKKKQFLNVILNYKDRASFPVSINTREMYTRYKELVDKGVNICADDLGIAEIEIYVESDEIYYMKFKCGNGYRIKTVVSYDEIKDWYSKEKEK